MPRGLFISPSILGGVREDNKAIGKTTVFAYDNNGNITERCEYAYTSKSGEELSELECEHHS